MAVALSATTRAALSFQSYHPAAVLDGVVVQPLRKLRAENGWFAEYLRLDRGGIELPAGPAEMTIRQISFSHAAPGRINAFHIHPKTPQNELWTVVQGQLLIWLADCRADSPTEGVLQKVILSGEQPACLYIPAGVAHGYRAGGEGGLLVYAMDRQFDIADPNEGRLPWDFFGAQIWEEDRG
jgi:dTDP-4-dehydrorhamnose 3,5-epimerase